MFDSQTAEVDANCDKKLQSQFPLCPERAQIIPESYSEHREHTENQGNLNPHFRALRRPGERSALRQDL